MTGLEFWDDVEQSYQWDRAVDRARDRAFSEFMAKAEQARQFGTTSSWGWGITPADVDRERGYNEFPWWN